ncbi:MAG: energy transducer TonB [Flavobacterium sp.]
MMNYFWKTQLPFKRLTQFILFFLFPIVAMSQNNTVVNDTIAYTGSTIDKEPDFKGGLKEFYKYIAENYNLPTNKEFKGGKVFSSFIIEKDGAISNVKVLRDVGFGSGDEAVRVIKASPAWIPGEINGVKVRVKYTLPLTLQPPPVVTEPKEQTIADQESSREPPTFSGGLMSFYKIIMSKFRSPDVAGLNGKIIVSFVVGIDGTLGDFKIIKDIGYGAGDEIVKILKKSPKWQPAMQNGKPVACTYVLPIVISNPMD